MAVSRQRKTEFGVQIHEALLEAIKSHKISGTFIRKAAAKFPKFRQTHKKVWSAIYSAEKKKQKKSTEKAPRAKGKKKQRSSSEDSDIECKIWGDKMPKSMTLKNAFRCMGTNCNNVAHQKCGELKYSIWTCVDCDSDDDVW